MKAVKERNQLTPFGKCVKKTLIDKGMTLGELEKAIGAPANYTTQILHGYAKESIYFRKIGEYLNIDVSKYT